MEVGIGGEERLKGKVIIVGGIGARTNPACIKKFKLLILGLLGAIKGIWGPGKGLHHRHDP